MRSAARTPHNHGNAFCLKSSRWKPATKLAHLGTPCLPAWRHRGRRVPDAFGEPVASLTGQCIPAAFESPAAVFPHEDIVVAAGLRDYRLAVGARCDEGPTRPCGRAVAVSC